MAGANVEVHGLDAAERLIAGYDPRGMDKRLQQALTVAGRKMKPVVRAAAPRGQTGVLAKSVSARKGKFNKPSVVVGPKRGKRGAFYAPFVARGTKPHRIRFHDQVVAGVAKTQGNIQHPGAKPNDWLDRVIASHQNEAQDAFEREFFKDIR